MCMGFLDEKWLGSAQFAVGFAARQACYAVTFTTIQFFSLPPLQSLSSLPRRGRRNAEFYISDNDKLTTRYEQNW